MENLFWTLYYKLMFSEDLFTTLNTFVRNYTGYLVFIQIQLYSC